MDDRVLLFDLGVLPRGAVAVGVFWRKAGESAELGVLERNLFPAGRVLIATSWNPLSRVHYSSDF